MRDRTSTRSLPRIDRRPVDRHPFHKCHPLQPPCHARHTGVNAVRAIGDISDSRRFGGNYVRQNTVWTEGEVSPMPHPGIRIARDRRVLHDRGAGPSPGPGTRSLFGEVAWGGTPPGPEWRRVGGMPYEDYTGMKRQVTLANSTRLAP